MVLFKAFVCLNKVRKWRKFYFWFYWFKLPKKFIYFQKKLNQINQKIPPKKTSNPHFLKNYYLLKTTQFYLKIKISSHSFKFTFKTLCICSRKTPPSLVNLHQIHPFFRSCLQRRIASFLQPLITRFEFPTNSPNPQLISQVDVCCL